ncbi:MAG TPA: Uma2 family endonuclease [Thermoanaerobaculia bacterium]|jgi:Uma2 family endonuclease|nr:Uma2 family endonuclease [Thermoanaerobaculia bacterium]
MALLQKSEEKPMTGEELLRHPELGPCELVGGRIEPMAPTGDEHGDVELEIGTRLRLYGKESKRGRAVSGEVGIYIRRNPDTVRAPDVMFISRERDVRPKSKGFFEVVPELVVEVLSPEDRIGKLKEKLKDYFSVGVLAAWVLDPSSRRLYVYRSLSEVTVFGEGEVLTDEELLPGFSVRISDLFEQG